MPTISKPDGRRLRGDASRYAVLRQAVDQASLGGLDSLTIGSLAHKAGVSKSNLSTLFGSKLELQLATIEAARDIFIEEVLEPALARPHGLLRLVSIVDLWLNYSEQRVFAGGCFFRAVTADASAKDDAARDLLVAIDDEWIAFLTRAVRESVPELPGLARADGPEMLAFEIGALLDAANLGSLLHRSASGYHRARASIRDRLVTLGASASISL